MYNEVVVSQGVSQAMLNELAATLSADFDLGAPVRVGVLGEAGHGTFKVESPRGRFVAKPAGRPADVALYAEVAAVLNARGIRAARPLSTRTQSYPEVSGYVLCEFLDGTTDPPASLRQTVATMSHLGSYLRVLAEAGVDWRPDERSFWAQVADIDFLLTTLPRHLDEGAPHDRNILMTALGYLKDHAAAIRRLNTQLVHGDVAPDNVVMDGDSVVAIIDFTPFYEPALFSIACALYWFLVHGRRAISAAELAASLAACGRTRPWSREERALVPAMLVREALRRLATPLEAPEPMQVSRASIPGRRRNLRVIVDAIPTIEDLAAALAG